MTATLRQAPGNESGALSPLRTEEAVADLRAYSQRDHSRFGMGWSVDEKVGQVGTGELALMWARSGAGKSTWFLNVIRNTPKVPTVVVNMEMTARRQVLWLCSMTYDLEARSRDIEDVLRYRDEDSRYPELSMALDKLPEEYPDLHWVTPTRPTVSDLGYLLDDIEDSSGVRPVRMYIDHVGLMGGAERGYEGYTTLTSGLHSFALQEDLSVIACQQTGRGSGDGQRNDGHAPVTLSSGLYAGEADADWVYGLYQPQRHPKFKKPRYAFDDPNDYWKLQDQLNAVRGVAVLQVIKNRTFNDLEEEGIRLRWDRHNLRYTEEG